MNCVTYVVNKELTLFNKNIIRNYYFSFLIIVITKKIMELTFMKEYATYFLMVFILYLICNFRDTSFSDS